MVSVVGHALVNENNLHGVAHVGVQSVHALAELGRAVHLDRVTIAEYVLREGNDKQLDTQPCHDELSLGSPLATFIKNLCSYIQLRIKNVWFL